MLDANIGVCDFWTRDCIYANTWGGGGHERGQKSFLLFSLCIYDNLFSLRFHCDALLMLQRI